MGNFGLFFGNWGERGTVEGKMKKLTSGYEQEYTSFQPEVKKKAKLLYL